jgi:tetratricopeptide (TPR) repeat protein
LALCYISNGQPELGKPLLEEASSSYSKLGDTANAAACDLSAGRLLLNEGNTTKAIQVLEHALAQLSGRDSVRATFGHATLALAYWCARDRRSSLRHVRETFRSYERCEDCDGLATSLTVLALWLDLDGKLVERGGVLNVLYALLAHGHVTMGEIETQSIEAWDKPYEVLSFSTQGLQRSERICNELLNALA